MEKRYQVFVSSTYEDLQAERQEVMQALLELDCIPSGMELFPAANDDQWTLIKRVIDDCDYYILIVGGRYGSIGPAGISYTQMEYEYALQQRKPVIAFLHKDPSSLPAKRTEQSEKGKLKLEEFRTAVQQKMCKYWNSPAELGSVVSRSLIFLIKTHPAVGWVRADLVPDKSASEEILRLKKQVEELSTALNAAGTRPPAEAQQLSQGTDPCMITYSFLTPLSGARLEAVHRQLATTWNVVFAEIAPLMMNEANEEVLKNALNSFLRTRVPRQLAQDSQIAGKSLHNISITDKDFQTLIIQFRALNLITRSSKQRSLKDQGTYWTLTPYGDTKMTQLRAIKKPQVPSRSAAAAKPRVANQEKP